MPIAGSVVAVIGHPYAMTGLNGSGILIVTVNDIVYNPGTAHIHADSQPDAAISPQKLQVRKRKRAASVENPGTLISSYIFTACMIWLI